MSRVSIIVVALLAAAPALAQGANQTSSTGTADVRSREATQSTQTGPAAQSNLRELKAEERNSAPPTPGASAGAPGAR